MPGGNARRRARVAPQQHRRCRSAPIRPSRAPFYGPNHPSLTDPTVKGLWSDQSRSQFFEFTMDARAERQVLGEIAPLVIDLDCARQPAGSALWGSTPELLSI